MKRTIYLTIFLVFLLPINSFGGFFGPSNYWECILEEMSGVKNDAVASEAIQKCRKNFSSAELVEKKSSIIGIKTAGECVLKYAQNVTSPFGAKAIRVACYKLYPKE